MTVIQRLTNITIYFRFFNKINIQVSVIYKTDAKNSFFSILKVRTKKIEYMRNTDKLIEIYFHVCDCYDTDLVLHYQRMSNNYSPKFTDEEVITIFLFGIIVEKKRSIKEIYNFADNYLRSWFPRLVDTYEGFLTRLNNLPAVFPVICQLLLEAKMRKIHPEKIRRYQGLIASVVDSMPIILAKGPRSFGAKITDKYCNKGYCASKKLHYYGLKLHVMGFSIFNKLLLPEYIGTSPASNNDLAVFKPVWETIEDRAIFADKFFANKAFEQWLFENNNLQILTPVKKKKGQKVLKFIDQMYSRAVSQVRQPIESFFNWIIEKVGIQNASKIRSEKGLLVHVYGRFAAALMIMTWDIF
jgi:hypothetical protein